MSAALAFGVAAIANAARTTIVVGNLKLTFGGSIVPKALPKSTYAAVTSNIEGKIETTDGTHPSAFRETEVDVDKDVKVSVKGLPVCKLSQLVAVNTAGAKKACGSTILGSSLAHAEIAFPEQKPIIVTSRSRSSTGGEVTLLIHTFITVPVPAAIVTTVTIQRKGSGLHSVAKIPVIAGGSGSVLDFKFKLGRTYSYKGRRVGYLEARCPDGVFKVNVPKAVFKNEARLVGVAPITTLNGKLAIPCTPKG